MSQTDPVVSLAEAISLLRNACDPSDVTLRSVIDCSIKMVEAAAPQRAAEFQARVAPGS